MAIIFAKNWQCEEGRKIRPYKILEFPAWKHWVAVEPTDMGATFRTTKRGRCERFRLYDKTRKFAQTFERLVDAGRMYFMLSIQTDGTAERLDGWVR